ncbi:DUF6077 domain-containing protein [Defluviimonas aestuarii]|uniref:DUF6077 domain-containing protein n=1 Tax=Albidovulum aestuarii TaxID=1130726 RepID=UPI00249A2E2D|nr:DUF6077 domain-containing protein [Defluviimonas aestuarii]MDI3335763.1 DUF6077 domain-containing protein [Defluviimonas aestuarii]
MQRRIEGTRFDRVLVRAIAGPVGFFAVWTVICNVGVQAGMTAAHLTPSLAVALLGGVLFARMATDAVETEAVGTARAAAMSVLQRYGAAAAMFVAVAALYGGKSYPAFWLIATVTLVYGVLRRDSAPVLGRPVSSVPPVLRRDVLGLMILIGGAMAVTLLIQRPDQDDANFLNLAVGMLDDPRPILQWDTMIGDPTQPIHLPTYRVEALPALFAALSGLTGWPVITVAHLIWPPLMAALSVVAIAALARRLLPGHWLLAVALTLAFLLLNSGANASYGNFSFVRFQQGKGAAFTILVPLIYLFALRFWSSGGLRDWTLLAATQAAMVGMTANGIYLAPVAAILVFSALMMTGPVRTARYVLGGLTSLWPVLMGGVVLATTGAYASEYTDAIPPLRETLRIFGANVPGLVTLWIGLAVWSLLPPGFLRRFSAAVLLVFLVLPFNPLTFGAFADHVTGNLNYRLFYTIPIPALTGIGLAALAGGLSLRNRATIAGVTLVAGLLLPLSILAPRNGSHIDPFGLKIVQGDYRIAREVAAATTSADIVLAPESVAIWIATMEPLHRQIAVRELYLVHYRHTMVPGALALRQALFDVVNGKSDVPDAEGTLRRGVEAFGLSAILFAADNPRTAIISRTARALGFTLVETGINPVYFLYLRKSD